MIPICFIRMAAFIFFVIPSLSLKSKIMKTWLDKLIKVSASPTVFNHNGNLPFASFFHFSMRKRHWKSHRINLLNIRPAKMLRRLSKALLFSSLGHPGWFYKDLFDIVFNHLALIFNQLPSKSNSWHPKTSKLKNYLHEYLYIIKSPWMGVTKTGRKLIAKRIRPLKRISWIVHRNFV